MFITDSEVLQYAQIIRIQCKAYFVSYMARGDMYVVIYHHRGVGVSNIHSVFNYRRKCITYLIDL